MTRCNTRKWTTLGAIAVLFAASGQACPADAQAPLPAPAPVPSLAGVWTGVVSGELKHSSRTNATPPNPNDHTSESTNQLVGTVQVVVDDSVRLVSLPQVVSTFINELFQPAVTVFTVGEKQTITGKSKDVFPVGAADTTTNESSFTITLTVTDSFVTTDHFRVIYATKYDSLFSQPSVPRSDKQTSTGTLTLEATLVNGQLMFSADFQNNGSFTRGATPPETGNYSNVLSLTGTLAAN